MSPSDLPAVAIIQSEDCFWLRVETEKGIDMLDLKNNQTLPGARSSARELGYEPEAWVGKEGYVSRWLSSS